MLDDYLPTRDAAELAGVSEEALRKRRQREQHHPPIFRVGGAVLYERAAFARYCESWTDGRSR